MKPIAHIETDFGSKFGVPRQSGLVPELEGRIVFEPAYRVPEAFRGLEGFSHIWLLWDFSESHQEEWSPTVRPPRLGGNVRVGVFATRSPFRPNPIGLSCVQLSRIDHDSPDGPVLWVRGADLMDGTPIFDNKPYLPFADSHPEASG
ncbi:MAG: tRNA (N6-threonylcarbamoyladenosine(37)-N6)-methyltransferase TrmO, partial [Bacteroidales bacterium]|nr:tRNA (N6-threonylcarbamoyladenosine(37)-N6)-methyltransferase TrmO [Bacteroidales bacterium]